MFEGNTRREIGISDKVTMNILDPLCGNNIEDLLFGDNDVEWEDEVWSKAEWVITNENDLRLYHKWADKATGEIYVIVVYRNGEQERFFTTKAIFMEALKKMEAVSRPTFTE